MQTFIRCVLPFAALLFIGCSSTTSDAKSGSGISRGDFAGKRFNAVINSKTGTIKKDFEGAALQMIFDQDSTGRLRATKGNQFSDINFVWRPTGDGLFFKVSPANGNNMNFKVRRDGGGFMLSEKEGSILLTP